MIPGARKEFVRRATERAFGREGVLKHVSGSNMRRERRFYDEAVNMHRMNGMPGILPVRDIDDTLPGRLAGTPCRVPSSLTTPSGMTGHSGMSSATSPFSPMS